MRAITCAYKEKIGNNAVHLPVKVNDQALSELILDPHSEFLLAVKEPRALNQPVNHTLRAIFLTNEGETVEEFLCVGLAEPLDEERGLAHEVKHLGQVV